MIHITLSEEIISACPGLHVLALCCEVENRKEDEALWEEIEQLAAGIRETTRLEEINKWEPIRATRQTYKLLGKDPNRYRPSSEALRRRILRELPLYRIDILVDIINLLSIESGYSIGGFDADKIEGELILGVGRAGEPYEAIGRGMLNIEGLPVYRDAVGGIGTPTSDEERTKIDLQTKRLLMIINGYSGLPGLMKAMERGIGLLREYARAKKIEACLINRDSQKKIDL